MKDVVKYVALSAIHDAQIASSVGAVLSVGGLVTVVASKLVLKIVE